MEKKKHTQGPWAALRRDGWNNPSMQIFTITPIDFERITSADGAAECEANARLIAAAPEMLEALIALMGNYSKVWQNATCESMDACEDKGWLMAKAAITKAEGRQ